MKGKYHFIGIGGIGMSGLARLLLHKDVQVSGSDICASTTTEELAKAGAKIYFGHSAENIEEKMMVIYSTDIKEDNPEYRAAIAMKCPLLHRSELLQKLMENHYALAVAGTHGKTTTSALLAWVFKSSGNAPSYAIGGILPQFNANSGQGNGKYFIAEACESDGTFLNYSPYAAIVTNIDFDHMDYYRQESSLFDAFRRFMSKVAPERLLWCGDNVHLQQLNLPGISYGFDRKNQLRLEHFVQNEWSISFDVEFNDKVYKKIEVSLTGKHNALNAAGVFGLALILGLEEGTIRAALKTFGGVLRRCEKKAEVHGILFLDDYAHHPTEIEATLKAIRKAIGERRMIVAYQPHRYTRAQTCLGRYKGVFEEADELLITEIYAAREEPIPGVTHAKIIEEIQRDLKERCRYVERRKMASTLSHLLRPHDVLLTLGAGDITKLSSEVLGELPKNPAKLKVGVIFGGVSTEHEVSLISVENILSALNQEYYDIKHFGITRQGRWIYGSDAKNSLRSSSDQSSALPTMNSEILGELLSCDILFPVLHGTYGEDGTLQGFFEMISKAYVGCDHRSSAICMSKVLTKRLAIASGIDSPSFVAFNHHEWKFSRSAIINKINDELVYPVYVKPVHLGSSVGITKILEENQLQSAIEYALRFDTQLIVENGVEGAREIEFSVLGNNEITVFPPGEVYANGQLHDYDSKYGLNPAKAAAEFATKANLPSEKIQEGMELAEKAYRAVGCQGMARVDTFLDRNGKFWFNEINTIPGFTKYSLYPLICSANGLSLSALLDRLIILGLQKRRVLSRLEIVS